MKKAFLFFMCLMASMATWAAGEVTDYGVTGDFNNWGLNNKLMFYTTDDPNVLKATTPSFNVCASGFKIVKGTEWNGNEWGSASAITHGVDNTITKGAANIKISGGDFTIKDAVFTLTLADDAPSTLKVEGTLHHNYYLPGSIQGWGFKADRQFEVVSPGVYRFAYNGWYGGEFKVVKDGTWGSNNEFAGIENVQVGEYDLVKGGSNCKFGTRILKNPVFTLTVDGETHHLKVECEKSQEHSYGLVGDLPSASWKTELAIAPQFEQQPDGTFTLDYDQLPGNKGFKISIDNSWTCFCPSETTTYEFNTPFTCPRQDAKNMHIGEAGKTYKVHIILEIAADEQSATITVTKPVEVATADTDFYSLYLGHAVTIPSNVTAYTGQIVGDYLKLTEIGGTIPANTGVVFKTTEAGTASFDYVRNAAAFEGVNDIKGVTVETAVSEIETNGGTLLVLGEVDGKIGFAQPSDETIAANKAYVVVPASSPAKALHLVVGEDVPTGISNVNVNGNENRAYNLQGQRVQANQKGIVIVNGRKVFNK